MTNIDKEREALITDAKQAGFTAWKVNIHEEGIHFNGKDITNNLIKFAELIQARAKQHSGEAVGYRVSWNDKFRGCGEILYTLKEFEEYSHVEIAKNHACLIENKIEKLYLSSQQPKESASALEVSKWKPTEAEILKYASEEELFLFADESDLLAIADGILELVQIKIRNLINQPTQG